MTITNALLSLALLVVAAACGNTADGVKKDADNAAEKTSEVAGSAADEAAIAAAKAKAQVSGALQTGEIKTAIMADTRVAAAEKAIGYSIINNLSIKP